jgi:hypothetical protein
MSEVAVPWYGIRHVFKFGVKSNGMNIFEERVVVFKGDTQDEAHAKARKEAQEYAQASNLTLHPHSMGYEQDGDDLLDGYEVWSELYETRENLEEFYANRYEHYRHHPD